MMAFQNSKKGKKKEERRKSTRRICRQDTLTSVSKVIDYNLKWKSPSEQRKKGYEKVQFEIIDV